MTIVTVLLLIVVAELAILILRKNQLGDTLRNILITVSQSLDTEKQILAALGGNKAVALKLTLGTPKNQ